MVATPSKTEPSAKKKRDPLQESTAKKLVESTETIAQFLAEFRGVCLS